ncbi:MAG: hypothetical protein PHU03_06295 [Syntrophales bacterium]|nr:hypothetical protein [Syntrophales bacterium]
MDRRKFIELGAKVMIAGTIMILTGCGKKDRPPEGMGNQERLWNIAAGSETTDQPLEPLYAQGTPAFFRDASLGRVDPSFVPQTTGGG